MLPMSQFHFIIIVYKNYLLNISEFFTSWIGRRTESYLQTVNVKR